jgi:YfiH family protein
LRRCASMPGNMRMPEDWIVPDWPAPACVHAVTTTRQGGVSQGAYTSMNPADHVGDDPEAVAANRARLQQVLALPARPAWLQQVHGITVVDAASVTATPQADAAYACRPGAVCSVLTADCLPLLLCDRAGECIAAVHAGWRGLAAGVIEQTVHAMGRPGATLLAWLGPAIGSADYRVGDEVRGTFMAHDRRAAAAFRPAPPDGWHADLYQLARQRLGDCGVMHIYGGRHCSYREPERFFSYRRDGACGRMASLIWIAAPGN